MLRHAPRCGLATIFNSPPVRKTDFGFQSRIQNLSKNFVSGLEALVGPFTCGGTPSLGVPHYRRRWGAATAVLHLGRASIARRAHALREFGLESSGRPRP